METQTPLSPEGAWGCPLLPCVCFPWCCKTPLVRVPWPPRFCLCTMGSTAGGVCVCVCVHTCILLCTTGNHGSVRVWVCVLSAPQGTRECVWVCGCFSGNTALSCLISSLKILVSCIFFLCCLGKFGPCFIHVDQKLK